MKRLLWSMSLACFLPSVAGMPAEAKSTGSLAFEPNTQELISGFASENEVATATAGWSAVNVAKPVLGADKTTALQNHEADVLPLSTRATKLDFQPSVGVKTIASRNSVTDALPFSLQTTKVAVNPELAQPQSLSSSTAIAQQVADACNCTSTEDTTDLNNQLDGLRNQQFPINVPGGGGFSIAPAISINNPVGFGADRGVGFISGSYQSRTRFTQKSDGEVGIGLGLFDATDAVGLEVSYSINSFGTSQGFGSGGFNAKLHKRFGDAGLAVGWNRFANVNFGNTGVQTDYPQNSYYAVATQVIRNGDDIDGFLSRIALSAGVGGGQFLSQDTISATPAGQAPTGVNAFGSAAFRLAKPLSAIVEWTGQDLAAGLSITPFDGFPLVITPAFRDISGISGESARFVLGVGTAWQF